MPTLTIDNRTIKVPAGTKVIAAAEQLGIIIPRFCYHPALGSVGACRVCAVAFLDGPVKGIQMSCMVNAQDGMVVSTTDAEAVDFRRHVIEWLMLNHPHDCPVCDEGGHCLLQDTTVAGGHGLRRYRGTKRTHQDQYLGPLVQHEMNRCIQCYRCARYYQQVTGYRDLGVMGIGSRVYFGRSTPGRLESPFSGNLIDICPTGVYTDKPSRFFRPPLDFQRAPAICLHCSLGCNIIASARYRQVVRHEARPNPDVNGHFICDRGRYAYPYASAPDRPRRARVAGSDSPMEFAVATARQRLETIADQAGSRSIALLGSARNDLETLVVLKALCREHALTGPVIHAETCMAENVHAAARHLNPDLAVSLGAISVAETIVVIGADPINEAPMLAVSLRQAVQQGGHVTVIDPRPVDLPLAFDHRPVHPDGLEQALEKLIAGVRDAAPAPSGASAPRSAPGSLADRLTGSRRAVIVCGTAITTRPEIDRAAELVLTLRTAGVEAKLFFVLDGPNAFAAGLLLDAPSSLTQIVEGIEDSRIAALVVVDSNPCFHFSDRERLARALEKLSLLIVLDHTDSPMANRADVFLPTRTVYETGGQWINQEGRLQSSRPVLAGGEPIALTGGGNHPERIFESRIPGAEPAAAWRLAAALFGDATGADALLSTTLAEFARHRGELEPGKRTGMPAGTGPTAGTGSTGPSVQNVPPDNTVTLLMVEWTFGTEELSARSPVLGELTPPAAAVLHSETAAQSGLTDGGEMLIAGKTGHLRVPCKIDDRTAPGVVVIPRHHLLKWQVLGATRVAVERNRIKPKDRQ